MSIRRIATSIVVFGVTPSAAMADPVAIVEDIDAGSAIVEFMDYVEAGQVIPLAAGDVLVLGYFKSCLRETIIGGIVTVGATESTVTEGGVIRETVDCDGGQLILTPEEAGKSGVLTFRTLTTSPRAKQPTPEFRLYGTSPIFRTGGPGSLIIRRLDRPEDDINLEVAFRYIDLAEEGLRLTSGGLYEARFGKHRIVFHVDAFAYPGSAPIISRLIRF